jgi:hypothetical protein
MIRSLKAQWGISIFVAIAFIYHSFSYTELSRAGEFDFPRLCLFLAMIFSVYNAGMLTQKYIHSKKNSA